MYQAQVVGPRRVIGGLQPFDASLCNLINNYIMLIMELTETSASKADKCKMRLN